MQPSHPQRFDCAPLSSAAVLGLLVLAWLVGCGDRSSEPVNVLLISIDTLRPDRLGCYGHERDTSPTLDMLAEGGTLFTDVTSASPWTLPSHATLLTGLYPRRHGVRSHTRRLNKKTRTLATRLAELDYATMGVVNSHNLSKRYGLGQGFQDFEYVLEMVGNNEIPNYGDQIVDLGLEFLDAHAGSPFFMFLHFYDVHSDFTPRPEYREQFVRPYDGEIDGSTNQLVRIRNRGESLDADDTRYLFDLYDAEIRQLDDQLSRLFDRLEALGLAENTLVVVTSDHGEAFGEHDSVLHGQTHYEEVIRIPLLMRGPGVAVGSRVSAPVHLVDVAPTILAAAGIPDDTLDGIDLRALASGAETDERYLYSEADHNNTIDGVMQDDIRRMIRFRQHKLLFDTHTEVAELYDIGADPSELADIVDADPELAALLMSRLESFMNGSGSADRIPEPSEEDQELLRSLGYMDGED